LIINRYYLIVFFIILIITLLFIGTSYWKSINYHKTRINGISSQIFDTSFGDIEYLIQGEGPAILVSHGITGGVDQGIGLARDYIGSEYRLIIVSRFGYLKSAIPENPSPEKQADAYNELIEYLNIEQVYVFGNSAGSTSALQFAIKYPEKCRGLILVAPNAPLEAETGNPPMMIFSSDFVYWVGMRIAGNSMMGMFVPESVLGDLSKQERNQLIQDIFFSALPVSKRTRGIEFDLFTSNPSINGVSFNEVEVPTLILNAVDDPATLIEGARYLDSNILDSTLIEYETGGHILLGQGDEIKNQINEFIDANR